MPSKSKRKGNKYERELVDQFKASGFDAKRAWGSNGKSIGLPEEVDVEVKKDGVTYHYQAKIRRTLPSYLQIPECCNATLVRQDNDETLVILRFQDYIKLLQGGT